MKFYYLKDICENYHPVFPYLHDNFIILFFLSFIKYKSSQKKKIHFLIPFELQHLFLPQRQETKKLTTKFSKITKSVRKNGRKLSLTSRDSWTFTDFRQIPRPDIYFHMSLESATTDLHDLS